MREEIKELLKEGIKQIEPRLCTDSFVNRLEIFFNEILFFNPVYKLVSDTQNEDFEEILLKKHFLDCLAPVSILGEQWTGKKTVADLGSGSGLPGLVLALADKELNLNHKFFLVERMGRRAGFLRNTVVRMGLNDTVEVIEKDIGNLNRTFDAVVFRAFRPVSEISRELLKLTDSICIYKSGEENIEEDILAMKKKTQSLESEVKSYQVPFADVKRSILVFSPKQS